MSSLKIMVVEDEVLVARDLKNKLEFSGYVVPAIATSAEEAIQKAAEFRPDVLLMDIHLQGEMDGVQAAEIIRASQDIPILFLTAFADNETVARAKTTEPYGYIMKPFQNRELMVNLEMVLYKHAAEKKLKESEAWLSATLKSVNDGVVVNDADGRVRYMNPAAEQLTGWTVAEALHRDVREVIALQNGSGQPISTHPAITALREKEVCISPEGDILAAKDGRLIPVDSSAAPIKDAEGYLYGVVLAIRDVTSHSQAQAQMVQMHEELERRVGERTAELEAANRELEAFSYSVSHDLRTPLRSIDGFSRAILEDCSDNLTDEGMSHLDKVRASAQHMGKLIDGMLKMARLAKLGMQNESVDLSALAGGVVQELKSRDPHRSVEIIIQEGLCAQGDRTLLRVVLENLLENAWNFSSLRPLARIEVGSQPREDNGDTVFFVRDNGIGFDMAYTNKLFHVFQRLHGAEFPGTGFGLASVQRIILRHSGRVWAESAPDKGATFFFTLP